MSRFTARPYAVQARQYQGNTLNLEGGFNSAVIAFAPGGRASISYRGSAISIEPGDWLVRGPDGVVAPVTAAAFELMFQPEADAPEARPEPKIDGRKLRYAR